MLYACVEIFNKISCIWRRDNFWMKRTVMLAFNFNFQNYQKCVPKFAETSPAPKNSWLRACSEYTTTFTEFCFLDIIKLFIKNAWTKCFWLQYQCFFFTRRNCSAVASFVTYSVSLNFASPCKFSSGVWKCFQAKIAFFLLYCFLLL